MGSTTSQAASPRLHPTKRGPGRARCTWARSGSVQLELWPRLIGWGELNGGHVGGRKRGLANQVETWRWPSGHLGPPPSHSSSLSPPPVGGGHHLRSSPATPLMSPPGGPCPHLPPSIKTSMEKPIKMHLRGVRAPQDHAWGCWEGPWRWAQRWLCSCFIGPPPSVVSPPWPCPPHRRWGGPIDVVLGGPAPWCSRAMSLCPSLWSVVACGAPWWSTVTQVCVLVALLIVCGGPAPCMVLVVVNGGPGWSRSMSLCPYS